MSLLSLPEAAERLGVHESRVRQRIADGSLPAERVGGRWVIEGQALQRLRGLPVGRPLSARSAWALISAAEAGQYVVPQLSGPIPEDGPAQIDRIWSGLSPMDRSRGRKRLAALVAYAAKLDDSGEQQAEGVVATLRHWLGGHASRRRYVAAPADLDDLRADGRLALAGLSHPDSGMASGDLSEAYVQEGDLAHVVADYLLEEPWGPSARANVVLHVLDAEPYIPVAVAAQARLALAADLAEHGGARERGRAFDLVHEVAAGAEE